MNKTFEDVLKDIEERLKGKTLKGISNTSAPFVITDIDYEKGNIVLDVSGNKKTWTFERLDKVWKELYYRPAADVEIVFGGSGSSRNQVETIYASLGYIEYLFINKKKCIAYVGHNTHPYGELKQMDDELAKHYAKLLKIPHATNPLLRVNVCTGYYSKFERNRILFGAPGTGKSYTINKQAKELIGVDNDYAYERVTFHPDYSYANFVGTYKPVPSKNDEGKDTITYEYVPGPFMRVLVKALKNSKEKEPKPFLLIIEEINRANVAAVFGDVFQLLDRGDDNVSEYPIQASEDIKKHLSKELGGAPDDYAKIRIPDNMFIWATMNSADQGVFPMDTAFKRRWDFTYLGIDDNDENIRGKYVYLCKDKSQKVEWNKLRKAINNFLAREKINEDKQLGPYFIAKKIVVPDDGDELDSEKFCNTFKNKVIMYLFEDAAKQKRHKLFEGCGQNSNRYSDICKEFDAKGIKIFNQDIQDEAEPESVAAQGPADNQG